MTPTAHVLPFGKHRNRPLPEVPSSYLEWALRECKLSSGLRNTVAAELQRRGIEVPSPPPRPAPQCRRCPTKAVAFGWMEDRLGRRHIRATCAGCNQSLGFMPVAPPYTTAADAAASRTPILDALTRLESLGVELVSDGRTVWLAGDDWRKVPPDLMALVRQQANLLAGLIGDTWTTRACCASAQQAAPPTIAPERSRP